MDREHVYISRSVSSRQSLTRKLINKLRRNSNMTAVFKIIELQLCFNGYISNQDEAYNYGSMKQMLLLLPSICDEGHFAVYIMYMCSCMLSSWLHWLDMLCNSLLLFCRYLTMESTRRVVPLLHSDPHVLTLPLVGM